jgi:hypothetical protein
MITNVAKQNNALATARAFATYALVPYLGILFCPGALVMGSVGVVNSYRLREPAGRGASYSTMVVATIELAAQLTLWWILYKIPEWSRASIP